MEELRVKRIRVGSEPEQNQIESCRNRTGSKFLQKSKCDVQILTNSIRQSNELEIRRGRKKTFLQQCRRYGSNLTKRCDDGPRRNPRTSQWVPERRNEKTGTSKYADTEPANNRGAAGRRKNGGLTNGRFAPKLASTRRQICGEWGHKKTQNLPEQVVENAAKMELWPRTEWCVAIIREFENRRCQTA